MTLDEYLEHINQSVNYSGEIEIFEMSKLLNISRCIPFWRKYNKYRFLCKYENGNECLSYCWY